MTALPHKVAVIGAGEIGCGWAALCASAGWPVTVFDASARTLERASIEVPRRARALVALERATQGIVERGLLEFQQGRSLLQAVQDADWVIEAIPEDLLAKQKLFAAVEEVAGAETLVTSSSSGLPPSEVFARCRRQDRATRRLIPCALGTRARGQWACACRDCRAGQSRSRRHIRQANVRRFQDGSALRSDRGGH